MGPAFFCSLADWTRRETSEGRLRTIEIPVLDDDPVKFWTIIALHIPLVGFALSASAQEVHSPHWSYEGANGPEHWGELSPDFFACKEGLDQSPIDVTNSTTSDLPRILFDYKPAKVKIIDNGHTVQVNYPPGSFITVQDHRYELVQFHFHHPSEELIQGRRYDLEIHLVHQDAEQHKLVIAVLGVEGDSNPAIAGIFSQLPRTRGREVLSSTSVTAKDFLPKETGYFVFAGSLTTPPCTEGVRWIVLKSPVKVSKSDLAQFAARYPHNARPTQPMNGRKVLASR